MSCLYPLCHHANDSRRGKGIYDKVANALLYDAPYTEEDDAKMRSLLQKLCEPSLLPFYKALDGDFYNKYLA